MARDDIDVIRARLERETGTLVDHSPEAICLLYPSPYHAGMSSLGFQTLYRAINARPNRAAHRAFLPDDLESASNVLSYEMLRPIGDYRVLGLSVAYELELAGVVRVLQAAGIPPLARDRGPQHPFVLAGGPLTFSNPLPLAPFADAILMGEADDTIHDALDLIFTERGDALLRQLAERIPSAFVPSLHEDMPPVARAADANLPARSQITTPDTELRDMFLIEPERGCHRGCTYCVMRRSTNGGMRLFDPDEVLGHVPEHARRVGLVGAATTDHPRITEIVESLVDSGREVGLSSLRADRLNDRFVAALRKGGQTVLTTAADGASARLRKQIQRRAPDEKLREAAHLAKRHGFRRLKLYMMVGLPDENDDDIDELIDFSLELSRIAPPISLGIAPFCAKRNTPMDGMPFAGIQTVDARLKRLRKGVKGRVELRATSARWAWVEYVLAQGGRAEGEAVVDVVARGGKFRHWKDAFEALPEDRPQRPLVRPGDRVLRVMR